jgi:opacity protein-like surface antigen
MKKSTVGFLSLAAAAVFAAPAHAQLPNVTPFSFEVRGGLAAPLGDFGETTGPFGDVKSGTTLGANVTLHFMPLLGLYGGYSYNSFSVANNDNNLVDQGVEAGLRLAIPTPLIPIDPYVKGGAVYHRIGQENASDSDNSLGLEVGAGIGIGLGPKLSFTPQVTYTSYESKGSDREADRKVSHVRVDVGLRIRL